MNLIEKATIMHYHRHRIASYKMDAVKALGWRGSESQLKRFEVFANIGDLNGVSILDVGCGYGDLKAYLDQRFSDFVYIGIDQMPEFISEAQSVYKNDANTTFYQSDFSTVNFPKVDYVFASGALGYRCADPDFYTDMISKMFAAAKIGLAFNLLDAACFPEDPLLIGHDVQQIFSFCKTLSQNVELIRGYLNDDFTVFVYCEPYFNKCNGTRAG